LHYFDDDSDVAPFVPTRATEPNDMADRSTDADPEASALDRARLSARAINAIERIWGRDAKRRQLVEPDAYQRLRQTRGIGDRSIAEIERAVIAWGFDGIGGKRAVDPSHRKRLIHQRRLSAALRDLGARGTLLLLSELCAERLASYRQKFARRPSRLHRARYERAVVYYTQCDAHFREWAEAAPVLADAVTERAR
jgi:hypothetical protein